MSGGRWNAEAARIGGILRQHRKQYGYSQREIAEVLGLSRPIVSNIERGHRKVSTDEITKLATHYGKSIGAMFHSPVPLPSGMLCTVDESGGMA